ncbi:MAG: hypothetical protein NW208_13615 [Bryobacter sp.]|nr:hypothetical protein [Bryobacter sp.]
MKESAALFKQAEHLAFKEPRRPSQTSLRHSVSALYYALFHLWTRAATENLALPEEAAEPLKRSINHGDLKGLFSAWSRQGSRIHQRVAIPCSPDLAQFAELFVALQEARHKADYDFTLTFKRSEVRLFLGQVRGALDKWRALVKQPDVRFAFVLTVVDSKRFQPRP